MIENLKIFLKTRSRVSAPLYWALLTFSIGIFGLGLNIRDSISSYLITGAIIIVAYLIFNSFYSTKTERVSVSNLVLFLAICVIWTYLVMGANDLPMNVDQVDSLDIKGTFYDNMAYIFMILAYSIIFIGFIMPAKYTIKWIPTFEDIKKYLEHYFLGPLTRYFKK